VTSDRSNAAATNVPFGVGTWGQRVNVRCRAFCVAAVPLPLCVYPKVSVCDGNADPNDAASYRCRAGFGNRAAPGRR
jgi:hypothetical protein